jgi:hypothetical protein
VRLQQFEEVKRSSISFLCFPYHCFSFFLAESFCFVNPLGYA